MIESSFLGGGGYICSNLFPLYNDTDCGALFLSRSSSKPGISRFETYMDIPLSRVIFDFSHRADGLDIINESDMLIALENIKKNASRCEKYFFISTASININDSLLCQNNKYAESKKNLEEHLLNSKNIYILRLPLVFGDVPKQDTVINVLLKIIKGQNVILRDPNAFFTALHINDLKKGIDAIMSNELDINTFHSTSKVLMSEEVLLPVGKLSLIMRSLVQQDIFHPNDDLIKDLEMLSMPIQSFDTHFLPVKNFNFIRRLLNILRKG